MAHFVWCIHCFPRRTEQQDFADVRGVLLALRDPAAKQKHALAACRGNVIADFVAETKALEEGLEGSLHLFSAWATPVSRLM